MLPRVLIIFLFTILGSFVGHGQTKFNFGLESGFSVSKFPNKSFEESRISYSRVDYHTRKDYPLLSPVIGFKGYFDLNSRFKFLFGIQYQITGTRFSGTNSNSSSTAMNSFVENKTLHKFSFPLATGYSIKIKNNQSVVFIGYRPNLFITGKYYYRWDNRIDMSYINIIEYNPLSSSQAEIPLQRLAGQFLLIVENKLSGCLNIGLSLCVGKNVKSKQFSSNYYYQSFSNNDLFLTLSYLFNSTPKNIIYR